MQSNHLQTMCAYLLVVVLALALVIDLNAAAVGSFGLCLSPGGGIMASVNCICDRYVYDAMRLLTSSINTCLLLSIGD